MALCSCLRQEFPNFFCWAHNNRTRNQRLSIKPREPLMLTFRDVTTAGSPAGPAQPLRRESATLRGPGAAASPTPLVYARPSRTPAVPHATSTSVTQRCSLRSSAHRSEMCLKGKHDIVLLNKSEHTQRRRRRQQNRLCSVSSRRLRGPSCSLSGQPR